MLFKAKHTMPACMKWVWIVVVLVAHIFYIFYHIWLKLLCLLRPLFERMKATFRSIEGKKIGMFCIWQIKTKIYQIFKPNSIYELCG